MAFFSIFPDEYGRRGSGGQRQSKRGIMHVDQVIIQADRMVPNRNGINGSRMRYQDPPENMYVTDPYYGPPERKRMRRDYSVGGAPPYDYEAPGRSDAPEDLAYTYDRLDTHVHAYPKRSQPASSWESSDSSYSSVSQSIADYAVIQEERRWTNNIADDGNRRNQHGTRNKRFSRKRSSNAAPAYEMNSPCKECCKPPSDQLPVEVQIQECPGLPEMRAYVVVPLGRTGAHDRGQLDQAARRAARAVPPLMRVSRRPQAIVVECNRNNDISVLPASSTRNRSPASSTTTATAASPTAATASSSAPLPSTSGGRQRRSRDPTPEPSLRQEEVDGLANTAVAAAAAAATTPTTPTAAPPPAAPPAPATPTTKERCRGSCAIANLEAHGKITAQVNTLSSSTFTFLQTSSLDEDPDDGDFDFDRLKVDSVASSLASMDCCTFISKLPKVLLMMDKTSKRFQVPTCFGNVTNSLTTEGT